MYECKTESTYETTDGMHLVLQEIVYAEDNDEEMRELYIRVIDIPLVGNGEPVFYEIDVIEQMT